MSSVDGTVRLCCIIRNSADSFPLGESCSSYAHRLGHSQLRHAIEDSAFYLRFRALGLQAARPESPFEQLLESEHRILSDTLARVPTQPLPRRASQDVDLLQDTITYGSPSGRILCRGRFGRASGREDR